MANVLTEIEAMEKRHAEERAALLAPARAERDLLLKQAAALDAILGDAPRKKRGHRSYTKGADGPLAQVLAALGSGPKRMAEIQAVCTGKPNSINATVYNLVKDGRLRVTETTTGRLFSIDLAEAAE